MKKKSFKTELEKIDEYPFKKFMLYLGVIPAIIYFVVSYFVNPTIAETFSTIPMMVMGIMALTVFSMMVGLVIIAGAIIVYVATYNSRDSIIKKCSPIVAEILAHDETIRKRVVDGIVNDITEEMKKRPDSQVIEKMQLDIQTILASLSKIQEELRKPKEK